MVWLWVYTIPLHPSYLGAEWFSLSPLWTENHREYSLELSPVVSPSTSVKTCRQILFAVSPHLHVGVFLLRLDPAAAVDLPSFLSLFLHLSYNILHSLLWLQSWRWDCHIITYRLLRALCDFFSFCFLFSFILLHRTPISFLLSRRFWSFYEI